MPLINAEALGEDNEDKIVANGKYKLRITSAKVKTGKKNEDRKMINCSLANEDVEGAATIFHNVIIPLPTEELTTQKRFLRDYKRFMRAFGVPEDGAQIDEDNCAEILQGLTADLQVIQEEARNADGDKTGDMNNVIRLPKVVS